MSEKQEQERGPATVPALAETALGYFEQVDRAAAVRERNVRRLAAAYARLRDGGEGRPVYDQELEAVKAELGADVLAAEAERTFPTVEQDLFYRLVDGAPAWVEGLAFAAHEDGQVPPDNWRYDYIVDALGRLAEAGPGDDFLELGAEIEGDCYTSALTEWLNSDNRRVYFLGLALEEYGGDLDGFQALSIAQEREKREVFDQVLTYLEAQAAEAEAGEGGE